MLVNEIIEIMSELNELDQEMTVLKPKYEESTKLNSDYSEKKRGIRAKLIVDRKEEESEHYFENTVNTTFNGEFPEFKAFSVEHEKIIKEFRLLTERIRNLVKVLDSIKGYNEKITDYFKNKAVLAV